MPVKKFFDTILENISGKDIAKIFIEIFKTPGEVKFNIDEFPQIFSEKIEEIILNMESKTGEEYISGIFNIIYVDEKSYRCSFDLYFKDKQGKINSYSAESGPVDISKLTKEAITELQSNGKVKFEIPEPSREARDKFNREKSES